MNILKCFPAVLAFSALSVAEASEGVSFLFKPLLAGRASLTESGFVEARALGTACFAPELELPVEMVYRSASKESGMFCRGWSSPQLGALIISGCTHYWEAKFVKE